MKLVRFYFDPISPYAWLASKDLRCIEAADFGVEVVPVLFAGLLKASGLRGPVEIPIKRVHVFRDVMRLAAEMGLKFAGPPGHPFNPLMALRMCTAVEDLRARRDFTMAMLTACWEKGLDVSSTAGLVTLANACGLDGEALAKEAVTPRIKQALTDATALAAEAGMFGVPTFEYEGDYFWGADRIDSLLWRMAGNRIDEAGLQEFLDRPPLAERRLD